MNTSKSKKTFSRLFTLSVFALSAGILFFSCNSTKQETETAKDNTTFVNSEVTPDNKLFSSMIFSQLTGVKATNLKTHERFDIPLENCIYNKDTTQLTVKLPREIPYKMEELVFTITGVPLFPAEFILYDALYKNPEPLIFFDGKKAVLNTDYTIDKETNRLTFIAPVDADKSSYKIMWATPNRTISINNNVSRYEKEYKELERQLSQGK